MKNPECQQRPQYYFSLPRLVVSQLGWNAERTESNWLEANVVGAAEHLICYLFAVYLLLHGLPLWEQLALLIPVAVLVWICWLIVLYLNAVLIRLLRVCGLLGQLSNARAQSVLLGSVTTAFAFYLVGLGSWLGVLGIAWIGAVALNLLAAAVLVVSAALHPAAE